MTTTATTESENEIKPGDWVRYASSEYEVAELKDFPHGPMIGIYDEPPGKHVDYLNPSSVTKIPSRENNSQSAPPFPAGMTRGEVLEGLATIYRKACQWERSHDPSFRRWPDVEATLEHIAVHGIPPRNEP